MKGTYQYKQKDRITQTEPGRPMSDRLDSPRIIAVIPAADRRSKASVLPILHESRWESSQSGWDSGQQCRCARDSSRTAAQVEERQLGDRPGMGMLVRTNSPHLRL